MAAGAGNRRFESRILKRIGYRLGGRMCHAVQLAVACCRYVSLGLKINRPVRMHIVRCMSLLWVSDGRLQLNEQAKQRAR